MKKRCFLLTLLFVTTLSFGQSVGDIIITEIMLNPSAVTDANGEYFEVYNTTGLPIDMNGWVISDAGTNTHTVGSSVIVPSLGYAVFGRNGDSGTNGGVTVDYAFSFTLANTEDEIILTFSSTIIDEVHYDATFPNPAGASMELATNKYNAADNDSSTNWGDATSEIVPSGDLGTPGITNDFVLSVAKNEIESFSVYPNPVTNDVFTVRAMSNSKMNVGIYDLLGKQVFTKSVLASERIDVSNLTEGVYVLRVEDQGKLATRKLVLK